VDELNHFSIRQMRKDDLAYAAECTSAEGWVSEGLTTLEGFYLRDPHGCCLAEIDQQPVGVCIATSYGRSGFIGELIVKPEARGRGVGAQLLNRGMQILCDQGAEAIYLDGVLRAVDLYERHGFRKLTRSWRFSGQLPGKLHPQVRLMSADDLEQVLKLDESYFGADRSFFLRRRFQLFPDLSYVLMHGSEITGYILGRQGTGWLSAGPWVVREQSANIEALLHAIALHAEDISISLGVLDTNREALELLRSFGFAERSDSPWRMVWGKGGDLGASPGCYAVGSAAKG